MKTSNEEQVISEGKLNQLVEIQTRRPNGSLRIQWDYQYCPTMTEQHTAHLSDINYLMSKYKPDEVAAYIAARTAHRVEILGHDFSQEPNLQEAQNIVYNFKQKFNELPDEIRNQFQSPLEFLKFIDNPANQEKMVKLGLLKEKQIKELTENTATPAASTSDTKPT